MEVVAWLPVVGYEGWYEVSSDGSVRSVDRVVIDRRGRRRRFLQQRLSRVAHPKSGHMRVALCRAGSRQMHGVHVLVAEAFIETRPAGLEVCHKNGISADNRVENLEWGTRSKNQKDSVQHGTRNMASRSQCPQGHPLRWPNLSSAHLRNGQRSCLACHRARAYIAYKKDPKMKLAEVSEKYFEDITRRPA